MITYQATQKQINLLNSRVRVWDNHEYTADRYSVAIRYQRDGVIVWDIYTMSSEPNSPQGVNQYSHTATGNKMPVFTSDILGIKRTKWSNTPLVVVNAILNRI